MSKKIENYKKEKALKLCDHMLDDGKVVVKDKHDNTVKESRITAVYADYTVTLPDTVHSDYCIGDVTIIPIDK